MLDADSAGELSLSTANPSVRSPASGIRIPDSGLRSQTRLDMIEAAGRLCQLLSLPKITGQIYGLLFLATEPLGLGEIASLLQVSKGSASSGTRQLLGWGAIKRTWIPGKRRDLFEVIPDVGCLIRAGYMDFLKPRLSSSGKRLSGMEESLDRELQEGLLTEQEHAVCRQRLNNLSDVQQKLAALMPLLERFV
jgi:DNA-binding transcriptional regulator GbsR (MarR family)